MKKALVTGSAGLIGSESVKFLVDRDFQVTGIDNDLRIFLRSGCFYRMEPQRTRKKIKIEIYPLSPGHQE